LSYHGSYGHLEAKVLILDPSQ